MLSYPFSIFYYEIEKRKTKGRYIHGPLIPGAAVFLATHQSMACTKHVFASHTKLQLCNAIVVLH